MAEKIEDAAILICIAGVIGAGKTTLARKLGRTLAAKVLEEEVSGNELLEAFYRDPGQYALPVQAQFLLSRFNQLRADCWPKQGIVVADYLFDKDHLFAELNLKNQELQTYLGLWDVLKNRVRQPNAVIYLRAETEFLLERIRHRDRSFERGIPLDYLERLAAGYEKMLADYKPCPVIRITSASEPARNQQSWRQMLEKLIEALPQLSGKIDGSN